MIYPALIGAMLNLLFWLEEIELQGMMALIAGVAGAVAHIVLHSIHGSIVRRALATAAVKPINTSSAGHQTRVAGSSSLPALGALAGADAGASPATISLDN